MTAAVAQIPLLLATAFALLGCDAPRYSCSEEGARKLARAAFISSPIYESKLRAPPERIGDFVARNRTFFGKEGESIHCAQVLGPRLIERGIAAYDRDAYARRMGGGPEELRPDVAKSLNENALQIITIGREISWLAEVLPALSEGDATPYWTTGTQTRVQWRTQLIPALDLILAMGDDCGGCTIAGTIEGLKLIERFGEEQPFMLAMMTP
jgi:hypothetical protein